MKEPALIILLSLLTLFQCLSQISDDDRLRALVKNDGQAEISISYPGKIPDILVKNLSVSKIKDGKIYLRISPLTVEWFLSRVPSYTIIEKSAPKSRLIANSVSEALQWDIYPTYLQYLSIMEGFTEQYPGLCEIDTIGNSINGKHVLVLKISDNAPADENEPEVFYSSTMHGDETAGFVLMLRLADHLLSGYATDDKIRDLVDNLEIWINPLANPDGTFRDGNEITDPVRFNANGYDLNRNFPDPMHPYGAGNIQQKETSDMVNFLRKHRFVLSANFHSGSELVNYPWDAFAIGEFKIRDPLHADDAWFYDLSRSYVDTVHLYSEPSYMTDQNNGVTRGADWYVIYGGRQDFVTWELQGREVTIELHDPGAYPYVTPPDQLPLLWEYNYRSLTGYLENALYGIHGRVTDSENSQPVAAKIHIREHDKDSSFVCSDSMSGHFTRLIHEGTYDITFSARGYVDTTLNGIDVLSGGRTFIDMKMKSTYTYPLLYPNPATNVLWALLPDNISGEVNIRIYNTAGMLVSNYNEEVQSGIPFEVRLSGIARGLCTIVFTSRTNGLTLSGRYVLVGHQRR